MMIDAYFRPKSVSEAIEILSRGDGNYLPLGGGVKLSRELHESFSVVDLQSAGLEEIVKEGQFLNIGATARLQDLSLVNGIQPELVAAIVSETNINLRRQATVAGALISATGRSTFGTAMLALDAVMTWLPGGMNQNLGEWFSLHQPPESGKLVSKIQVPLNVELVFEKVGRSPDDVPVLIVAIARWPSGRTRVSLGGFGDSPIVAFDAPEPGGLDTAVEDALTRATDQWASAEYRKSVGKALSQRMMSRAG